MDRTKTSDQRPKVSSLNPSQVSFRNAVVDDTLPEKEQVTMPVVEIALGDTRVIALPADSVNEETGERYCDLFPEKFKAFESNRPDPDRMAQIDAQIESLEAEKKGLVRRPQGDQRVQENLGYGKTDAETKAKESHGTAAEKAEAKRLADAKAKRARA